jgi:hypothetical protein
MGLKLVRNARAGYMLLALLLLAVVTAPLLLPGASDVAFARKYGRNYGARYAKYIARCKGRCTRTNGAIAGCIRRDAKNEVKNCRQVYTADRAACTDSACVKSLKPRLKLCIKTAGGQAKQDRRAINRRGYGVGKCNGCCQRTKGQGSCQSYFSPSRFYGSFRYRGRLNCYGSDAGPGPGTDCVRACEAAAKRGRAACGASARIAAAARGGDPACLAGVEAELAACLTGCQGSPSGAFLGNVSSRIRGCVAGWLPALVRDWGK